MSDVTVACRVPRADADGVFDRISDFEAYATHTDAVREVRIERRDGDTVHSTWSVNFRNGVLRWSEQDHIDPEQRTIHFTQTAGDFAEFSGDWRVTNDESHVDVVFHAEFDLGMPSLAALIDPIAEQTLRENMKLIVLGLLGDDIRFVDPVPLAGDKPE